MLLTIKAMKNPRSALCKTSIMAVSDIFCAFGDSLLLEDIVTVHSFDQLVIIICAGSMFIRYLTGDL